MIDLELTRELVRIAMPQPRGKWGAQVTLATVLNGTRTKYFFPGVLVPKECLNVRGGQVCCSVKSFADILF